MFNDIIIPKNIFSINCCLDSNKFVNTSTGDYMNLSKREKTGLLIFIMILLVVSSIMYYKRDRAAANTDINIKYETEKTGADDKRITSDGNASIEAYICGEVKKPGVYELRKGDRLNRLIELAGGFTDSADTSSVNLSAKIKDEDYYKIRSLINSMTESSESSGSDKININTAEEEKLKELPRIGDAMAKRIKEYRDKNGSFKRIEDLRNVKGIGPKLYEEIKDKISVY